MKPIEREVAEYIIKNNATVNDAAVYFGKSSSSIKKYLKNVRNKELDGYDSRLAEQLELTQKKIVLKGQKQGGHKGKVTKYLDESSIEMYVRAYMSGLNLRELSELAQIPKSTLDDAFLSLRQSNPELYQEYVDYYRNNSLGVNKKWTR